MDTLHACSTGYNREYGHPLVTVGIPLATVPQLFLLNYVFRDQDEYDI